MCRQPRQSVVSVEFGDGDQSIDFGDKSRVLRFHPCNDDWRNTGCAWLNTAYEYDKRPPAPDPRRVAAHRGVALFFGTPDVDAVYAHLPGEGIDIDEPTIAPYGMKQLLVQ